MAGESGTIKRTHGFTDPLSIMKETNPDLYSTSMPRMYPIHRHVYIHSVARRDFQVKHVYYRGTLPGCHKDERYVTCYAVPDPPQQLSADVERGGKRVDVEPGDEAGWRVAIDILNPNNPSNNPYFKPSPQQAVLYAVGKDVDLIRFGLFPSLNQVPTEEELRKAEAVRDETDQLLIDEAFAEQAQNPQAFRSWLRAHPEIYDAMQRFNVQADWMKKSEAQQSCPNCGDTVKAGIAFHKSSAGVTCIIDQERAAKAGVEIKRGPGRPPAA
jgi:hypothetical protein